ncbi:MAG: AI-2E family transporter [Pseudohongiellaceae bacterium]
MKILKFAAVALVTVLVFYLLNAGQDLLLPLVIAITLWYLINLLATAFTRIPAGPYRIPGPLGLLASILTFLLLGWGLINHLSSRIDEVSEVIPVYQENLQARLASLPLPESLRFDTGSGGFSQLMGEWMDLPNLYGSLALSFTSLLASGGIILIYIAFLMIEQGNFDKKISALVGNPEREKKVRRIISRIRDDIQKYISIKIFTSTLTGLLSYAFLLAVGVDFAGVWGLLIFLLNFIPTIGSIIATIFPAAIALAQSDGLTLFFLVLGGIGALQVAIGNFLEPKLMGSSLNLSPIIILLNLALWGNIWGVAGMFLCVPLLIITTIVLAHFPQTRAIAVLLSSDGRVNFVTDD